MDNSVEKQGLTRLEPSGNAVSNRLPIKKAEKISIENQYLTKTPFSPEKFLSLLADKMLDVGYF